MTDLLWLATLAQQAGKLIMPYYQTTLDIITKIDGTPVTKADLLAQSYLEQELQRNYPTVPVIGEESDLETQPNQPLPETYWLIDPIDGTKSFISGKSSFTVNIALISHGRPILGVIHAPALDEVTYIGSDLLGSFKLLKDHTLIKLPCEHLPHPVIISGGDPFWDQYPDLDLSSYFQQTYKISSSIKFCLLAEGSYSLYVRLGPTMSWDTAAGQAILTNANGNICSVLSPDVPLIYRSTPFENPHFVAYQNRWKPLVMLILRKLGY